jgi:hypothetical protein
LVEVNALSRRAIECTIAILLIMLPGMPQHANLQWQSSERKLSRASAALSRWQPRYVEQEY